ncbi:MAG: acyl-CoA dehydrogenase family protein [Proteobacteria bacterium]|nr:acyl-CoA dehydrogenase family protein [Pseudomonadota bacterium]
MSYPLPDAVVELQIKVRRFVDEVGIPRELEAEMNPVIGREYRSGNMDWAKANGLWAMTIPKDQGGGGLGFLEQAVVNEQAGRATNGMGWCFSSPPRFLAEIATPYQMETWVGPLIEGTRSYAYAITEEGAGSDVDAIESTARAEGNGYRLNGVKWHATGGGTADFFVFQAKREDGGHALFFVDRDSDGVTLVRTPDYMHSHSVHPIFAFEDVFVPADNLIESDTDAQSNAMTWTHEWFRYERLMIAARCCGAASRLIDEATAFAKDRVVYGQPIAAYQAIQFMLADSLTELWGARLMTYQTAEAMDRGEDVKAIHGQCAMAKLYASEMAGRVADRAVQIFGGRGYMSENVANRFFRELRVDRIWEGTSEIQRIIIAHSLFKRGQAVLIA